MTLMLLLEFPFLQASLEVDSLTFRSHFSLELPEMVIVGGVLI